MPSGRGGRPPPRGVTGTLGPQGQIDLGSLKKTCARRFAIYNVFLNKKDFPLFFPL